MVEPMWKKTESFSMQETEAEELEAEEVEEEWKMIILML